MSQLERLRRRRRRKKNEGMTLIEIMVVLLIIGLIVTAVTVAVLPQFGKAKVKTASNNVRTIRGAVQSYILNDGDGCPTVDDLIDAREIDETVDPLDPWDGEYDIQCDGDNIVVTSAGEDGEFNTEDDVSTHRN